MAINFEDQKFKDLGIEGAVRITGRPEVFTIGEGGGGIIEGQAAPGAETPESFQQKFGTLEQEGIVTEISPEQAAELGIDVSFMTPQEETLDVGDIDEEVPTDVLEEGADQFDINRIMSERQKERTALLEAMSPTEAETTISEELIEKQAEIEQAGIQAQAGIAGLEGRGRGITTGLVRGQQAQLQEQELLKQQTLQSQERTLLSRLGLEQEKRKGLIDVAKTMLGFTSEDIDMSFKIQDTIAKEQKDFMDRVDKLTQDAQDRMDDILKSFEGIDYEDLGGEEQEQLLNLAIDADIPLDLMVRGLKVQKDNFLYERNREAQKDALARQREARIGAGVAGAEGLSTQFWSEIDSSIKRLEQGAKWGQVWDRIKQQFPEASNEQIDAALGGGVRQIQPTDELGQPISAPAETIYTGWAKPGAFEEFEAATKEVKPLTTTEKTSIIWAWTNTDEYAGMTDEERSAKIRSHGLNPSTFGIY